MILSNFDPYSLHDVQKFALGQEVWDAQGYRWGYVQIREASGDAPRVMRSRDHDDFMSAGNGIVAAAEAVGSTRLTVASTSNRDFRDDYGPFEGAWGFIDTGVGIGQRFSIEEVISATEVRVEVFNSPTGGWTTALTTASRFALLFPGQAMQGDGDDDFVEGVLHATAVAADIGKYGYVQRSGLSMVGINAGGNTPDVGQAVVSSTAGRVHGITSPGTVNAAAVVAAVKEATGYIGRIVHDVGGSTNTAALVSLDIPPVGVSRKLANQSNSFNEVTIGR